MKADFVYKARKQNIPFIQYCFYWSHYGITNFHNVQSAPTKVLMKTVGSGNL